ncbi:MAG: class I SAM-dependent methyltransferase [Ignavibacteriales bacterium]|nr:class I SAM-dependent methyltransferase [Ignavibacteriales bacterium]
MVNPALDQINVLTKAAYNITAMKYHDCFKDEVAQKEFDRILLDSYSAMLQPGASICDAGCGPSAQYGKYLFEKGHAITGIDISEKCIQIASSLNPLMQFSTQDMMKTSFPPETFSGIVAFHAIVYTPKVHVGRIFAEFNRILKDEGKLLIAVKKGSTEGLINDAWYEGNTVHFSYFLEDEIKQYMEENNYTIEYLLTRQPYEFEIQVERIYAIGTKMKSKVSNKSH